MITIKNVCRYVRSKNAGPFWVTIDLFFNSPENFGRYRNAEAISAASIGRIFGIDPGLVKSFAVEDLSVVKISFPRPKPQGWRGERDMHSGQQAVVLLSLPLDHATEH